MEGILIYIAKSNGLLIVFIFAYYFLLRKETFFNGNRWFLLAGLFTSVILPFVFFSKIVWIDPTPNQSFQIPMETLLQKDTFEINWFLIVGVIYAIGLLVLLIQFGIDFFSLNKVLKGKKIQQQSDYKFIDIKQNLAPFSYFNYIVYNSDLYSASELENILEHEKVHSAQNHTIDVLIARLFCVVFWYNPFIWWYKKAILQNLEFIADSEATKNLADKKAYQITLLKITTHENCVVLTNHFYQSLIKKRIVMLNKNQSKKWNSLKYAIVIPALVAFVFLFQIKIIAQEKEVIIKKEVPNVPATKEHKVEEKVTQTTIVTNTDTTKKILREIYINGEKVSEEEMEKLNPEEIASVDVIKNNIDEPKIKIITKNASTKNRMDIPNPPNPPAAPNLNIKSPKIPKAPKAPKGTPAENKEIWEKYEQQMKQYELQIEKMEPEMKNFEENMKKYEEQMKAYEEQMEEYGKKMEELHSKNK